MMKSSTRRCSLGSIQSSGLKASGALPRGTGAAIWQGRSETSKFSTRPAPDSLARSRRHVASTPEAIGLTMPRPVTTTRLMCAPFPFPVLLVRRFQCGAGALTRQGPDWTPALALKAKTSWRKAALRPAAPGPPLLFGRRFLKVFDRVADGDDRLGLVVWNLDAELLFECHHQLYGVERVGAQIVDEIGAVDDLVRLHAEVLDDDLLHPLCDIAHVIFSLMCRALPPDF